MSSLEDLQKRIQALPPQEKLRTAAGLLELHLDDDSHRGRQMRQIARNLIDEVTAILAMKAIKERLGGSDESA